MVTGRNLLNGEIGIVFIDNVELTNECSIVEEDHGGLSNESRIE